MPDDPKRVVTVSLPDGGEVVVEGGVGYRYDNDGSLDVLERPGALIATFAPGRWNYVIVTEEEPDA